MSDFDDFLEARKEQRDAFKNYPGIVVDDYTELYLRLLDLEITLNKIYYFCIYLPI